MKFARVFVWLLIVLFGVVFLSRSLEQQCFEWSLRTNCADFGGTVALMLVVVLSVIVIARFKKSLAIFVGIAVAIVLWIASADRAGGNPISYTGGIVIAVGITMVVAIITWVVSWWRSRS